ncbi:general transcriptional corepressor trfA-like [Vespa velutina]|uniref:general transcriptional corepressor trfA-like n=1 Tax=Vespa velutina TaxID=202808 RepID=UPI001FB45876|nr:general transcriptional corepressor trfA-like [Vespa velutina]
MTLNRKKDSTGNVRGTKDGGDRTIITSSSRNNTGDIQASTGTSVVETVVLSSSSVHEEAKKTIVESESRSSIVESSNTSREVIMDSKGNVIRVIEKTSPISATKSSIERTGKSSEDFITAEKIIKQDGKTLMQDQRSKSQCERSKMVSTSTSNIQETMDHHGDIKVLSSNTIETRQANQESKEEITKNGDTISSNIQSIKESSEMIDDNGKILSSNSRSETSGESTVLDNSIKSGRTNVWDGTFINERNTKSYNERKNDNIMISNVLLDGGTIDERDAGTGIEITNEQSSNTIREMSSMIQETSKDSSKLLIGTADVRRKKLGESTWDGRFVYEKPKETKRRGNVSDANIFRHNNNNNNNKDDIIESTQRSDYKEKSLDGTYEKESSNVVHVREGSTDTSRFISEEKISSTKESQIYTDQSKLLDKNQFDANKNVRYDNKQDLDKTVVRRKDKLRDVIMDVQDITEEQQSLSNMSEFVSSSYVVEYASSSDAKNIELVTSVSETIHEEDIENIGIGRSSSIKKDHRSYKPGESTWDGSFVYERSPKLDRRRRPADETFVIHDVSEDHSINEADISTTSYIVEHSSSQQSFTDIKDSSSMETIVHQSPKRLIGKPGTSSWDGTFIFEKPEDIKRSSSRTEQQKVNDLSKRGETNVNISLEDKPRKHVNDVTLDIHDRITSETFTDTNLVKLDRKTKTHDSYYNETSNLDFSSTSVETVVQRDGQQPVTSSQRTITLEDRPETPDTGIRRIAEGSKESLHVQDRTYRPSKPGSSTWDGSFVYEKLDDRKTSSSMIVKDSKDFVSSTELKTTSTNEIVNKSKIIEDINDDTKRLKEFNGSKSPIDGSIRRPLKSDTSTWDDSFVQDKNISTMDTRTSIISKDISKDLTSSTKVISTTNEIIDSIDSSKIIQDDISYEKRFIGESNGYEDTDKRDKSPEKKSIDRTIRPSKPGASTWDGSFVYEKPQDTKRKPTDIEKSLFSSSDLKKPEDLKTISRSPIDQEMIDKSIERTTFSTFVEDVRDVQDITDVTDITTFKSDLKNITNITDVTDVSMFKSDVRDIHEEHVINEFITDTRKDTMNSDETERPVLVKSLKYNSIFS